MSQNPVLAKQIQQLSVALLDRPIDPLGQAFYIDVLAKPDGVAAMRDAFVNGVEFKGIIAGKNAGEIIDMLYQNLFGRSADTAGRSFWVGQFDKNVSVVDVALQIAGGAQGGDAVAYQSKLAAAMAFTDSINTAPEVFAYGTSPTALATARAYLDYVHDAASLAAVTTPFALETLSKDIVAGNAWSQPWVIQHELQQLYIAYLGRPADLDGMAYWSAGFDGDSHNPRLQNMTLFFGSSPEHIAEYVAPTSRESVQRVYMNLFGREGDDAGVAYWAGRLDSKELNVANLVYNVALGAQGNDMIIFQGKVAFAMAFTAAMTEPFDTACYATEMGLAKVTAYLANIKGLVSMEEALMPANIAALLADMRGLIDPVVGINPFPLEFEFGGVVLTEPDFGGESFPSLELEFGELVLIGTPPPDLSGFLG
jgi:hypothetical protein